MIEMALSIIALVVAAVIVVAMVVIDFIWWMKETKLRWPLAIIGLFFQFALAGGLTYSLFRFFEAVWGVSLWIW